MNVDPAPIADPYLLVLFGVTSYIDPAGLRYIDRLWAKDLEEHTRYIPRLTLAAPAVLGRAPIHFVETGLFSELHKVSWIDLPKSDSYLQGLLNLPRIWRLLWPACGRSGLVHSAVAGWPLPEAWVLAPILLLRPRFHYINVESAFWRLVPGEKCSIKRRIQASVTEFLNRRCVESADLSTFTQREYRETLLRKCPERGHIVEASWIDADGILGAAALETAITKRRESTSLRIAYVGRLTAAKGVEVLLDAVLPLLRQDLPVELEIVGDGPLGEGCLRRLGESIGEGRARLRASVPYGASFFRLLSSYHLIVVPTLSDEQPRIVFDAYSQGVPVIASSTSGLRQCVENGVTGFLLEPGNSKELRSMLAALVTKRHELDGMAAACVEKARSLTHEEMHRKRWRLLSTAYLTRGRGSR